jgi:dihydrofolate reductase
MRKVTFGGACSLDGYFAREDDAVDWLMWSDDVAAIVQDYWKNVDCIVMGRKTYEVGQKMVKEGARNPYAGTPTYVFSRSIPEGERGGITVVAAEAGGFIHELKQQEGGEICVLGGGELGSSLLNAGVIDELGLNIHPILLGRGIPVFSGLHDEIKLKLTQCRQLSSGCVYVVYDVRGEG